MTAQEVDAHPFSRAVAAAALAILSPVFALVAAGIKVSSRGPVLYRAQRAGRSGRPFTMFKFRTMHDAVESDTARITGRNDTRIFAVGRWLRRFKLDEIPQLVNVVRGEMAIVGPRPEDVSIVSAHYTEFMRPTLDVLPGLTSPGSLDYYADEATLPADPDEAERVYLESILAHKIALDLVYVQNRSWRYDAELVLRTLASIVGMHRVFSRHRDWEQAEAQRLLDVALGPGAADGFSE